MLVAAGKSVVVGALLLVSGPPMPDRSVDKMCAASAISTGDPTSTASCKSDERAARASLVKEWNRIPARSRETCLASIDNVAPSFVALKSCIDDDVDLNNKPR